MDIIEKARRARHSFRDIIPSGQEIGGQKSIFY